MDVLTEECNKLSHELHGEFLRFNSADLQARQSTPPASIADSLQRASTQVISILDKLAQPYYAEWFAERDPMHNVDDYVDIFAGSRNAWQQRKQREVPNLLQTLDKVENEWTIVRGANVLRQQLLESESAKRDLHQCYPTPFWQAPTATQLAFPMRRATDATVRLGKKIEVLTSVQYEVSKKQAKAWKDLLDDNLSPNQEADLEDLLPLKLILSKPTLRIRSGEHVPTAKRKYLRSSAHVLKSTGKHQLWIRAGQGVTFAFFLDERGLHRRATRYVEDERLREFEDIAARRTGSPKARREFQRVIEKLLGSRIKVFDAKATSETTLMSKKFALSRRTCPTI